MEKVSIILPVYNAEKTIKNTINSVLTQTYNNFELIIINDGSTDLTDEICNQLYLENNEKIIYISKNNTGVSDSRNIGLSKATGKYIMFLDSDEIYNENIVSKMVEEIEFQKADLVTCGYERKNVNKDLTVIENTEKIEVVDKTNYKKYIEILQDNYLFNQVWNKIYLNEIIKNNNIEFDVGLSLAEDLKFNLEYIEKINNASYICDILYYYINNTTGLSLKYIKNRFESNIHAYKVQEKIYNDNEFEMDYLYSKYINICLSGLKNIVSNPDKKVINEDIKKFCNDVEIHNKLQEIFNNTKSTKSKILVKILLIKNEHIVRKIAEILKIADILYKKIRLGY